MGVIATKWNVAESALLAYKAEAEAFLATDLSNDPDGSGLPSTAGSGELNSYKRQAALEAIRDADGALAALRTSESRTKNRLTAQGL